MRGPRRPNGLFFRDPEDEGPNLYRWILVVAAGFAVMVLVLVPLVHSGYFREQARSKQARHLVESQGYAYCAIWGDGTDPFQLMDLNSPYRPEWSAKREDLGSYVMTFRYRLRDKVFEHRWEVDVAAGRVTPLDEDTSVPISKSDDSRACRDTGRRPPLGDKDRGGRE